MRIRFITAGSLKDYRAQYEKEHNCCNADGEKELALFGFGCLGEVSYEKELKGETTDFEDVALFSKESKALAVCGCITDTRGHKRKSALVAENGRLQGVSDMLHAVDGEVSSGASLRIYDTKMGRMGVAVAEDLYFPDVVKSLAICGSDFIVCPFGKIYDSLQSTLLRAYAYCYGIPIFFCGNGYAMIADATGNIAFASPHSPISFHFENKREYHLIETRRRGFYSPSL